MKKLIFAFLALSLVFVVVGTADISAKTALSAGTLIKGTNNPTVYYYAEDNKRYVFPNSHTFYSWFDDFSNVVEINDNELPLYPLGGNVRYKPGALLVKIQTNPKVYAVGNNGLLRWIKTEALAKALYGENWSLLVDDVPDSFFVNYDVGDPVENESEYEPEGEEEETDSISCNLGLQAKKQIKDRIRTMNQKFCGNLEGAINRIQKRLQRWDITQDNIGDDYIGQCINTGNGSDAPAAVSGNKITICRVPKGNSANAHTITIAESALKAHLRNGDYIGACEGDSGEEPDTEEPDTTAPVISNIDSQTTAYTATISWTTDEDSDSKVEYALESISSTTPTTAQSDSSMASSHSIMLEGLAPETVYYYIVKSTDNSSNQAVSTEITFTTSEEPDATAPVISDISIDIGASTATISWATDESAKGKVSYATESLSTASEILEAASSEFLTAQSIELTGLTASTQYFFMIEAKDESDNIATSTEQSFTTSS